MSEQVQMNLSVYPELVDELKWLTERNGWSKRETVTVADAPSPRAADVQARGRGARRRRRRSYFYLRVAREIPGQLVEVCQSVNLERLGGQPAVRAEGWLIWEDPATSDLVAREVGGKRRFGRVLDGRIEPFTAPA